MAREAAQMQRPRVSRERGRQIMEATVDSIRRQIEADYPQLAEQGLKGWHEFKEAFSRTRPASQHADTSNDEHPSRQPAVGDRSPPRRQWSAHGSIRRLRRRLRKGCRPLPIARRFPAPLLDTNRST